MRGGARWGSVGRALTPGMANWGKASRTLQKSPAIDLGCVHSSQGGIQLQMGVEFANTTPRPAAMARFMRGDGVYSQCWLESKVPSLIWRKVPGRPL
jgi:hypothetical protein